MIVGLIILAVCCGWAVAAMDAPGRNGAQPGCVHHAHLGGRSGHDLQIDSCRPGYQGCGLPDSRPRSADPPPPRPASCRDLRVSPTRRATPACGLQLSPRCDAVWRVAQRHPAGGAAEVDVLHEYATVSVVELRDELTVRVDDACGRGLVAEGVVAAGEVDAVFEGSAEYGFLVVGAGRVAPRAGVTLLGVVADVVRVEHDLGASPGGPPDRLRVAERLVADGDAEGDAGRGEYAAAAPRHVVRLLQ